MHFRISSSNVVFQLPEVEGSAAIASQGTPFDAWSVLFTENILNEILEHRNAHMTKASVAYGPTTSYVGHLDIIGPRAFLILLIITGVFATDDRRRGIFGSTI
ncbi:hypothetical protein Trydic_g13724 [Trypoxylus dichotomus]